MKNSLPEGYRVRPASMDDLEATVEMFNVEARHMVGVDKFILQEIGNEWQTPGFDLDTDSRVVSTLDGQIIAYCEVWDLKPHVSLRCWGRVHPDHTNRGVGSYLLEWAAERARLAIPKAPPQSRVILEGSVICLNQAAQDLFTEAGLQQVRYALRMVIELDNPPPAPQWPEGIEVRTLVVDQDEWAMTNAVIESFRDHWGFVERPIEEEHERWMHYIKNNDDFDPHLYFLAWDDDQIAGTSLCWPKSHDDPDMGWVDVLGVRRPWRKQGLGLALLLHTFGEFYRREKPRVGLGVDAQNLTGALRLYERAGMHSDPERQYVIYEKELRPGEDLRTQ
jgi:mycothiol synthase